MPRDYKRALAELAEQEAAGGGDATHVGLPSGSEVAIPGATDGGRAVESATDAPPAEAGGDGRG
jgi:hypothetical protein